LKFALQGELQACVLSVKFKTNSKEYRSIY
jgi:hypothetical protein